MLILSMVGCGGSEEETSSDSGSALSSSGSSSANEYDIALDDLEGTVFTSNGQTDQPGYDLVAENADYQMMINQDDLTVMVKVKSTGYTWKTNLTEEELETSDIYDDTKNQYMSQIMLTYYDANNKRNTFNSYTDALENNNEYSPTVRCYSIDNGVRVVYKIGNNIDYFLLPDVMTEETYQSLYSKLSPDDQSTFESYYLFTKYSDIDEEQKGVIASTYPLIKTKDLYIIQPISKVQKERFVNQALRAAGITLDMVTDEYEKIGYNTEVPTHANFMITIDYTLTSDGLHINVPTGQIKYDSDNYNLYSISVLPFFGVSVTEMDGYMFIPDGSGALFDIKNKSSNAISLPFYGPDHTQWTKSVATNMQQTTLPVFGIQHGGNSFIAQITNGESQGTIECHPSNSVYPYAYITTSYEINEFETYASGGLSTLSNLLKFAEKPYADDVSIEYNFLTGENADYVGMAKKIRNKIFSDKEKQADDGLKFYYETYGTVLRNETFIGYVYNAKRSLTTIEECKQIYDRLREGGVENIALRYNNWYSDKYVNELSQIGKVSGKIGSKNDFKELTEYLAANNDTFYPNIEMVMEKNTSALSAASSHSKLMEGTLVKYGQESDLYQKAITVDFERLVVKSGVILNKLDGILKKMSNLNTNALSLSTVGSALFSDFSTNTVHRESVKKDMQAILEKVSENNKVMVEVGNAYVFPYVDDIINIPMSDSNLSFEEQSVPFLQIVLHGYVSYAGEPLNLADNRSVAFLKAIEYGAGIRYILNYAQPDMVKNTNYSSLYSTYYERWIDEAVSDYQEAAKALDGVQNCCITDHQMLANKVFMTTYENGTSIIVNYNDSDYLYNSVTVAANGFAVVKA